MMDQEIEIVNLKWAMEQAPGPDREAALGEAAAILHTCFPQSWPTRELALQEVETSLGAERLSLVARDSSGRVVGWIGGIRQYEGNVWELHPLVVKPEHQGRGIGSRLVSALETQARQLGGYTLWVGSDDETDATSLSGKNLYPDVLEHLRRIRNRRRHPYEFYLKLGFSLVGVMPDANGPGKPDLFLAKPLQPKPIK